MKLTSNSKKYIENHISEIMNDKDLILNKRDIMTTLIYKSLYKDIQEAFTNVIKLTKTQCIQGILNNENQIQKPNMFSSRFMSENIKEYIDLYGNNQITFRCTIFGKKISISFMLFSNNDLNKLHVYQKYAEYMYAWLYICGKYSSKICANTLHIYIYHTPFKKKTIKMKTEIFGPEHINSAYTTSCVENGEIIIFRKEEWFKVFIHETFHVFGFDFSSYQYKELVEFVRNIFPINSEFYIIDAYCETWARTINCAFASFLSLKIDENVSKFLIHMDMLIEVEKIYSVIQLINVLKHMGIQYQNLYKNDEKSVLLRNTMYREKTHVFCYYILTGIFMNDIQGFLSWCMFNNTINHNKLKNMDSSFIKFNYTLQNIYDFGIYIKKIYKSKKLLNNINVIEKYVKNKNSMRMSIVEF